MALDDDDVNGKAVLIVLVLTLAFTAIALWFFVGPPSWCGHSTWMC